MIVGADYSTTKGDLPGGDFRSQLAEGQLDFQFSPDVSLNNLVQWDNESDSLALQSRFRWILEPGSDLFFVVQSGWIEGADGVFRPDAQDLTLKLTHTLRF